MSSSSFARVGSEKRKRRRRREGAERSGHRTRRKGEVTESQLLTNSKNNIVNECEPARFRFSLVCLPSHTHCAASLNEFEWGTRTWETEGIERERGTRSMVGGGQALGAHWLARALSSSALPSEFSLSLFPPASPLGQSCVSVFFSLGEQDRT